MADGDNKVNLRVLCLKSGRGPPSAAVIRQILGLPATLDRLVPGDHCEVVVYEEPYDEAYFTLRTERSPADSFHHIVLKWCVCGGSSWSVAYTHSGTLSFI